MSTNSSPADEPVGPQTAINDDDAAHDGLTPSATVAAPSRSSTDHLRHHLRIHLTGAAAGIRLFERGDQLIDQGAADAVRGIRAELIHERQQLLAIAARVGTEDPPLVGPTTWLGERLGRLKPNGNLLTRTRLTDVVDLEAMRDAVAGKIAGWQALLAVTDLVPELRRNELADLLAQAERQHITLTELHAEAARRAFG